VARLIPYETLFGYRFHARFWQGYTKDSKSLDLANRGFTSMEVGAKHCGVRQTPLGLEVWTAHRVGEPMLFDLLENARLVEVVLFAPDPERKSRVFTLKVGKPLRLPFYLDAMANVVALDGVLFQETELAEMVDEVRPFPPDEERAAAPAPEDTTG
jgi:hypothetical protein